MISPGMEPFRHREDLSLWMPKKMKILHRGLVIWYVRE